MRNSRRCTILTAIVASCSAGTTALGAIGDINSVVIDERIFDDFTTTTLLTTDSELVQVRFDESGFVNDGIGGNFANRHAGYLSEDNGVARAFLNGEGFDFNVDVTVQAGENAPRKEAGIYLETFVGGQGQFFVTTDGEIAAFGQFPFVSSTNPGEDTEVDFGGVTYTPGTTVNLRIRYAPGDGAGGNVPATMEFFVDGVSSGPIDFLNTENGLINNSNLGVYAQHTPSLLANPPDFVISTFDDLSISELAQLLLGDANNDGAVTADDLIAVQQNFGNVGPNGDGTDLGDANDDGAVTADDLISVQQNFGNTLGPAAAAVPEPTALTLLGLAALATMLRRR